MTKYNKKPNEIHSVNKSLQTIAKGTGIVLIGSLISVFFGFVGNVLVIRYWTKAEYGVLSLALAILSICVVICSLGLIQGLTRNIAYSRGKKEYKKIPTFISISLLVSSTVGILVGLFLFLSSETIAIHIFHEPALIIPLRIFSVAVPILTLFNIIISTFRGFNQVKPMLYFQYILMSTLFPVFLIVVIVFKPLFLNIFYVYLLSVIVSLALLILYSISKMDSFEIFSVKSITMPATKELLFFSLPLLGTAVLAMVITWTDTLLLGSFKSSVDVGLYNSANPLARFISFPLSALIIMYMPIISGLYAKGRLDEIKKNFLILTKWLCSATLPLFIFLFMFSETIIDILFGSTYISSANVLRILAIGFIINNFVGPCGVTLVGMGKPRFIMFATLTAATLNVVLNITLIPSFGIVGAATASVIAIVSINLVKLWKLYLISGVQSLSKNLIKPTLLFLASIVFLYFIFQNFVTIVWWMLPPLFILFYIIYILSVLSTKSFDQEDLKMLMLVERKIGIKSSMIKRLLGRFV